MNLLCYFVSTPNDTKYGRLVCFLVPAAAPPPQSCWSAVFLMFTRGASAHSAAKQTHALIKELGYGF